MESPHKESAFNLLGLPKELTVPLTLAALLVTAAPFLGGQDLGLFKVPLFGPENKSALLVGGGLFSLLLMLGYVPLLNRSSGSRNPPATPQPEEQEIPFDFEWWNLRKGIKFELDEIYDKIDGLFGTGHLDKIRFDIGTTKDVYEGAELDGMGISQNGTNFAFLWRRRILNIMDSEIEWLRIAKVLS